MKRLAFVIALFVMALIAMVTFLGELNQASAMVTTYSDANSYNFRWDTSGTIQWYLDPWSAYAKAYAFDTLSGSDWDEQMDSDVSAFAHTALAEANGRATGIALTDPTAASHARIDIPDAIQAQAQAEGYGDLFNLFTITGGTGNVDVTFSLDYEAILFGTADELGYFRSDYILGIELTDGISTWYLKKFDEISGTDTTIFLDDKGTLTNTFSLEYDKDYQILILTDSEVYATNAPEPGTLILFILGLTGLGVFLGKKKKFRDSSLCAPE